MESEIRSGAIDLVGLTRSGDVVLIEFKTGPKNADFRSALAQLVDYGSNLLHWSVETFVTQVALEYFRSKHCRLECWDIDSIRSVYHRTWPEGRVQDYEGFIDRLGHVISSGSFHFVVVAQEFNCAMNRTADYLNTLNPSVRFYLVKMEKWEGQSGVAHKADVIRKPKTNAGHQYSLHKTSFLAKVDDNVLKARYGKLFAVAESLGLILDWSSGGMSIRLSRAGRTISVAWVYPPGADDVDADPDAAGFTFGYYAHQVQGLPSVRRALDAYVAAVSQLDGAEDATRNRATGFKFEPDRFGAVASQLMRLLADLVRGP